MVSKNNGKLVSPIEKSLDTEIHTKHRIDWVLKYYDMMTSPYLPMCFINERWFYRVNRRRAMKVLPKGKNEIGKIEKGKKVKCFRIDSQ